MKREYETNQRGIEWAPEKQENLKNSVVQRQDRGVHRGGAYVQTAAERLGASGWAAALGRGVSVTCAVPGVLSRGPEWRAAEEVTARRLSSGAREFSSSRFQSFLMIKTPNGHSEKGIDKFAFWGEEKKPAILKFWERLIKKMTFHNMTLKK